MSIPNARLFRNEALQHYLQGREKYSLPRFIPFPVTIFLWILLGLSLTLGVCAWHEEVPIYITGPGIILIQNHTTPLTQDRSIGAIFLQPAQAAKLHPGQAVFVQMATGAQEISSTIERIEPGVSSPADVQRTYGLDRNFVTSPSVVAIISLQHMPASIFAGSVLVAHVKTGSQRFISFIPGVGHLLEG